MTHGSSMFDLLRGGVRFNKRPNKDGPRSQKDNPSRNDSNAKIPHSISFFSNQGSMTPAKRKIREDEDEEVDEDREEAEVQERSSMRNSHNNSSQGSEDESEDEESDVEEGVKLFAGSAQAIRTEKKKPTHSKAKLKEEADNQMADEIKTFRKQMGITVSGDEIPAPIGTFSDIRLSKQQKWLLHGIEAAGWKEPTPIQMQAIPILLERRDLVACAPTGSGKTGAFVIPLFALLQGPKKQGIRGLIVSPTRELATQIFNQCKLLKAFSKLQVKLLTKATAASVAALQMDPQARNHDVVVSTPARLVSLLQQKSLDLSSVELLIVDEADKLFEEGFVSQIDEILASCTNRKLQKSLFSATIPPQIEELARTIMPHPTFVTVGSKVGANSKIKQKLVFVGSEEGKLIAVRQLIQTGLKPPVLMFVQSIDRAKQLFRELVYDGINVDVMHAERTQAQRDNIIAQFRSGSIWVLICTDLMARGIDFKGVNLVINYDFPQSTISYIHRIGRTGRGGREGEAVTLFTGEDVLYLRSIANVMKQSGCDVPDWMLQLKKPGKKKAKMLKKKAPERKDIVEVPRVFKQQRKKKQQIIEGTKKKKQEN